MINKYISGRMQEQFIRIAVIEKDIAYVPPKLFYWMQLVAIGSMTEIQQIEEWRRLLMLTNDEYLLARVRGLNIVVDYEMRYE